MKQDNKAFNDWVHGNIESKDEGEIEFDVIGSLRDIPRVKHLIDLGYTITNWTQYAGAELNELNS